VKPPVEKGLMERVFDEMERCTPATGYNLVGVDRFEMPGECAYVIGHHTTIEEAQAALAHRGGQDPDEDPHIYPAPPTGPRRGELSSPRRRPAAKRKSR
jgi:hypothetical protein